MRLKGLKKQRETLKAEFKAWLDKALLAAQEEGRRPSEDEQAKKADFEQKLANVNGLIEAERGNPTGRNLLLHRGVQPRDSRFSSAAARWASTTLSWSPRRRPGSCSEPFRR